MKQPPLHVRASTPAETKVWAKLSQPDIQTFQVTLTNE